ncbi:MAG TPA: pyridoxal phosphate-dependent aminotransferase [Desulfarculaceae bacterium]|nr:pyridoxal phosphate-dependent aminotransferase [Desulfarculaceae bacterium]
MKNNRIFFSAPHMGGDELEFVKEAFASNYIAPLGPQVDAFEKEFAQTVGAKYATALSSGTAALHLVLRYAGVADDDEVICSSFTFVASANAIRYQRAWPLFVDSSFDSWNIDVELLRKELWRRVEIGRLPKAMMLVHLYGQPADIDPILELCEKYDIFLLEDAAESLGATYKGEAPGSFGRAGVFSFNGNKIITTSGGGMVVSDDKDLIDKVKFWATQARDPEIYYQHSELGFNYRMSNILAAIGRGQLRVLDERVAKKRDIFARYLAALGDLPGVEFMPEPDYGRATRWLTCLMIDPKIAGVDRDAVIEELDKHNIESRPTWKPMHLQPLYKGCKIVGGKVSEELFAKGLCLPSGTGMTDDDLERVIGVVRGCFFKAEGLGLEV